MLRAILFSIALASGGVAAWLVGAVPSSGPGTAQTAMSSGPVRTTEVLVAASSVEQGTVLGPEQMRWQTWPVEAAQNSYILRPEQPNAIDEVAGSVARSPLVAGAPVVAENLAPAESSFLSSVLRSGMRAVAIRISAEKTAGGFILPNDRVDVLQATPCRPQDGCGSGTAVRTILNNVRVLAIDQSGSESSSESVLVGKTATLELTPAQAETIVSAEATGMLSLVLRAASDRGKELDEPSDTNRTVRVLRGGVGEYVKIR